jgi:N-acetylglucosamine-6-phosphate deacetylase
VLFNDALDPEGIATMAAAHRRFGTTSLLPTLITDRPEKLERGIAAVREAMRTNPSVLGIHLEGPFISARRPGVHDPAAIRRPTDADLALLTSLDAGVTLVTLAPEEVPAGVIAALSRAGVRVSLGHSMATYDETRAAMAEGLTGFTHLFNAMRPLGSRDPGPIAAALETPACWYGLIADGEHVDAAVLRLALRGLGRPMLVTDAMPPVGGNGTGSASTARRSPSGTGAASDPTGPSRAPPSTWRAPCATRSASSGSILPARSTWPRPRRPTSSGSGSGSDACKAGARADLVALDPTSVHVLRTWVAGVASEPQP